MNIKYYPYTNHLMQDIHAGVCGEQSGILQSSILCPTRYDEDCNLISLTGQMPYYHKVLIDPAADVQYHLGGYGSYYEEAIIRYIGEGIERYSLLISPYMYHRNFKFASYNDIQNEGIVMPFEYLDIYSDEDIEKLNIGDRKVPFQRITRDSLIGWLKCPSLFNPAKEIWIPLQLLFTGYVTSRKQEEIKFSLGFSKGVAAHTTIEKALLSAILEFIEIDATMINWYAQLKADQIKIDDVSLLKQFPKYFSQDSTFEVRASDLNIIKGLPANVLGCQLVNRKKSKPLVVYGAQADFDPIKCFYRAFVESVAITFLATYGVLYSPKEYLVKRTHNNFSDLDTNVAYYADPNQHEIKLELLGSMLGKTKLISTMQSFDSDNIEQKTHQLLTSLKGISEYAVYLDVTPPEAKEKGWHVVRTFFPELVTMCLPGIPPRNHPRMLEYGGVKNDYPHPLP